MARNAGIITIALEALTGTFDTDIQRSRKQFERQMKQMERDAKVVGAAIGAAITAIGGTVAYMTQQSIKAADEIAKMSRSVGVSVETLSTLSYAAERSGVQLNDLRASMVILSKNASDTARGTGEAIDAFKALGIEVKDQNGNLKNADVLIKEIAKQFKGYEDGANKTAIAVKVFGEAGAKLIPLLNNGADGIEELTQRARELGLEISDNTARNAEAFNDLVDDMGKLARGLANDLAADLLPNLRSLAEYFTEAGVSARQGSTGVSTFADGIRTVSTFAVEAYGAIQKLATLAAMVGQQLDVIGRGIGSNLFAFREYQRDVLDIGPLDALGKFYDTINRNSENTRSEMGRLHDVWIDTMADIDKSTAEVTRRINASSDELSGYTADIKDLSIETKKAAPAIRNFAKEQAEAAKKAAEQAKEMERLAKAQEAFARQTDAMNAQLAGPSAVALNTWLTGIEDANEAFSAGEATLSDYLERMDALARQYQKTTAEIEKQLTPFEQLVSDMQFEISIMGASEAVRMREIMLRQLGSEATEEQIRQLEQLIATYLKEQEAQQASREFQSLVTRGFESMWDALIDGGEDALDNMMDSVRDFAKELQRFWLRQTIIIPMQQRMSGQGSGSLFSGFQNNNGNGTGFTNAGGGVNWGNVGQFASGVYGVYDTFQNGPGGGGGALSGAAAGAQAGMVFGPWGAAIGAIIGALAGFFGGRKEPDLRLGGVGITRKPEGTATSQLGTFQYGARGLEGAERDIVQAVIQFDNQIADIVGSFSGGQEQLEEIRQALNRWAVDLKGDAVTAENVLGGRFDAILATFNEDIRAFVEGGADLQEQVQRLAEILSYPDQLSALMDELAAGNAFADMSELEQQLYQLNMQWDQIAAQAEHLGATEEQLALIEEYRANAIERLNDVQRQAAMFTEEAAASYVRFMNDIDRQLMELDGNEFQIALRGIAEQMNANIAEANDLARAAGLQGAREQDLARIHELAAAQAARAIMQLESASRDLVAEIYGTPLSQIEDQIAELEASSNSASYALGTASDALRSTADAAREIANAFLGEYSPLRGVEKANYALQALRDGNASLDQVLGVGRNTYASGADFNAFFREAVAIAGSRVATEAVSPNVTGSVTGLDALYAERDRLLAEQEAQRQFELAQQLAQNIADLSGATGDSFAEVADNLGVTLEQLAQTLGFGDVEQFMASLEQRMASSYDVEDLSASISSDFDRLIDTLRMIFDNENAIPMPKPGVFDDVKLPPVDTAPIDPGPITGPRPRVPIDDDFEDRIGKALAGAVGDVLEKIANSTERTANANDRMLAEQFSNRLTKAAETVRSVARAKVDA